MSDHTDSDGAFGFNTDRWPGAGKLIEEMGEALQVLGKLIVTRGDTDYWGDRDLRQMFIEELGDLEATLEFFREHNFTLEERQRIYTRKHLKLLSYSEWQTHKHREVSDV